MQKIKLPTPQQLAGLASASNLTIFLKALTMVIALLAFYYQDLSMIFNDALQNEATNYILAIPILFAYLVYRKRKMLRALIPYEPASQQKNTRYLSVSSGVLLCVTAVMLYWYGSDTFTPLEYHILTLPIFAAGLALILFNPQTLRQLAFPLVFLVFLTPPPSEILYGLGSTLSVISTEASNAIVNALGIASTISEEYGNPIIIVTRPDKTTAGFTVGIACSGIYSLLGFLVFAALIAYITRDKIWKKSAIFSIGFPLIYLFNIIRITIIVLIGYQYGEDAALQAFHLIGGWVLIFLGTLLLLTITEKVFKTKLFTKPPKQAACEKCNPAPQNPAESFCSNCGRHLKYAQTRLRRQDVAKMATILIAITLLISIQAPVFALSEGPSQVTFDTLMTDQKNNPILPMNLTINNTLYTLKFKYEDKNFEQRVGQEATLVYAYEPGNTTSAKTIFVILEIASTFSPLHRWETCLILGPQALGYAPRVRQLDLRDVQILQNPPIIARYFAFQNDRYEIVQLVLYWYGTSTFTTNGVAERKQVKVSLIAYPDSAQDVPEAENQLLLFATAVATHSQPKEAWVQIALAISDNSLALSVATATLLGGVIIVSGIEKTGTKKVNTRIYRKLSGTNQQTIRAVGQAQKETTPTFSNILKACEKNNVEGKITSEGLLQGLTEIEKVGLVKKQIVNQQDEPLLTWRSEVSKV